MASRPQPTGTASTSATAGPAPHPFIHASIAVAGSGHRALVSISTSSHSWTRNRAVGVIDVLRRGRRIVALQLLPGFLGISLRRVLDIELPRVSVYRVVRRRLRIRTATDA